MAGYTRGLLGLHQRVLTQSNLWGFHFSTEMILTKFTPPFFFSYKIVNSIFKTVEHDYYFYDVSEETVMVNHLYYQTRWGILGEVINVIFLDYYLNHIIAKRNDLLREYAETNDWKVILPEIKKEVAIVC